jgi:hypothetical protein
LAASAGVDFVISAAGFAKVARAGDAGCIEMPVTVSVSIDRLVSLPLGGVVEIIIIDRERP